MRKALLAAAAVILPALAWGAPIRFNLVVTTDRAIADISAEVAQALGQPSETRTTTNVAFDLEALDSGAYRLTFVTASQSTLAGGTSIPDIEHLGANLPGRWLEFAPKTLKQGGAGRSPDLTRDSEEIDYNVLAFMLIPPNGPLASLWEGEFHSAVACTWGEGVVALAGADAQPLEAFEGEASGALEYSVSARAELSQQTKFSTMVGDLALEGAGVTVAAADNLPAYARLSLTGERKRTFTVFGKNHVLVDKVTTSYLLVREGAQLPPEWTAPEEIKGE